MHLIIIIFDHGISLISSDVNEAISIRAKVDQLIIK